MRIPLVAAAMLLLSIRVAGQAVFIGLSSGDLCSPSPFGVVTSNGLDVTVQ